MSRRVRALLLAGCCLIALLEARRAGDTLTAGLSGPYATERPASDLRAELELAATPMLPAPILLFGPVDLRSAGWVGRGQR